MHDIELTRKILRWFMGSIEKGMQDLFNPLKAEFFPP
jgi:hypothetical protein